MANKIGRDFTLEHFEKNKLTYKITANNIKYIEEDTIYRLTNYVKRIVGTDIDELEIEATKDTLFSFDADDNPSTKMISTSTDAISGMHAGLLTVNDSTIFSQVANATILNDIPTSGDAVYLELDYKSEGDLFIGMIGYYDFEANSEELISYYLGLKKTDEWTKIYVNLSSELKISGLPAYRILFRAEYSGSGSEEQILIDNVKLIHF